jgi:hypothetical protein
MYASRSIAIDCKFSLLSTFAILLFLYIVLRKSVEISTNYGSTSWVLNIAHLAETHTDENEELIVLD